MQTYGNGKTTISIYERKASIRQFYCKFKVVNKNVLLSCFVLLFRVFMESVLCSLMIIINTYLTCFSAIIFPALLQLQKGVTDLEERKQKEVYANRYQKKTDFKDRRESKIDIEREKECGVCLEVKAKVVLPNCCHQMCFKCYREWYIQFFNCFISLSHP